MKKEGKKLTRKLLILKRKTAILFTFGDFVVVVVKVAPNKKYLKTLITFNYLLQVSFFFCKIDNPYAKMDRNQPVEKH